MKFYKAYPPRSTRTDYINEEGTIRFIRDDSAVIQARYMAVCTLPRANVIIAKTGATPIGALCELQKEALRIAAEIRTIVDDSRDKEIVFKEEFLDEIDR